jgi:hypothetical protein
MANIHSIFIAAPAEAVRLAWCERRKAAANLQAKAVIPATGGCVVVMVDEPASKTARSWFSRLRNPRGMIPRELATFKNDVEGDASKAPIKRI